MDGLINKYVKIVKPYEIYTTYTGMAAALNLNRFHEHSFPARDRNIFKVIRVRHGQSQYVSSDRHLVAIEDVINNDQFIFNYQAVEELQDIKTDEDALVYAKLQVL